MGRESIYPPPQPQLLLDAPKPRPVTVVVAPHPALEGECEPVEKFDDELYQLVSDLATTLYATQAIGIAAPQIKVMRRVFLVDLFSQWKTVMVKGKPARVPQDRGELLVAVNPRIVWNSEEKETAEEGCISFPGKRALVTRSATVRIVAWDHRGNPWEAEWGELLGRVVQHETDHLSGVTMVDHLPPDERGRWMKKFRESMDGKPQRGGRRRR